MEVIIIHFKKLSKKKIIISVTALIIALLVINGFSPKEQPYIEEVAKTQDISTYYSFDGNISAKDSQEVVSKTNLSVKKFYVKEEDIVNVGDLLFELDDRNISSSIDQAAASVELAKINYDVAVGTSKDQQTIQTTNALEAAQAAFDSAKLNLDRVQELYEFEVASLVELEQAQTSFENAQMQLKLAQNNYDKGVLTFFRTSYAANPRLRLYSIGLIYSNDLLILFSLYQTRYSFNISINLLILIPIQSAL